MRPVAPARTPEIFVAWLHLAVLWSLAISQPLFDVLSDSADFFVARGNTRTDILVFAFGVTLIPPTVLVGIETVFVRWSQVHRAVHCVFIGGLVAALALQVVDGGISNSTAVVFTVAIVVGALAALLYAQKPAVRSALTVLSPAPAVFLALFLLVSPVSKLVLPQGDDSAAGASVGSDTPVVLIALDEFAATALINDGMEIDASRFPHFARLAATSTWYRNATTVSNSTTYAVPAIASGQVPDKGDLPIASDYPTNVFSLLGNSYRLSVNEPATALCPERLCGEMDRGSTRTRLKSLVDDLSVVSAHLLVPTALDKHLPPVDQTFGGFRTGANTNADVGGNNPDAGVPASAFHDRRAQWARTVRDGLRQSRSPSLSFVHVLLPHFPWQYLPSGQQYATAGPDLPGVDAEVWRSDAALAEQGYQRFLLQAGYVDRLIGELIHGLKARGMFDRTMLVVTADHGVSFHPGKPRRKITSETFPDIAPVPLFIKLPNQVAGRTDDRMARTVDVLPTIADVLGVSVDDVDGTSLLSPPTPAMPISVELGGSDAITLPFGEFKRRRDEAVARQTALFGQENGMSGVFEPLSWRDLIGRRPNDIRAGPPASVTTALDSPQLYASVDPRGGLVPAFVTGTLEGSARPAESFAVAVNGTVRAVGPSYEAADGLRFSAIIDPRRFRKGANRLAIYAVAGPRGARTLSPVKRTDSVVAGTLAQNDRSIERRGGSIPIESDAMEGFIETLVTERGVVRTSGWAVDSGRDRTVDEILVFAGSRLVAAGRPTSVRPDIAEKFGDEVSRAGFDLSGAVGDAEGDEIRVFAISDGLASQIETGETTIR
jgi:hypothetical protein